MAYEPRSGTPAYGPWQTMNNSVHDNTIVHLGASGHDGNWPYRNIATALSWPNSLDNNHYVVPDGGYAFYDVGNQFYSWSALHQQQSAYETNSTLTVAQTAPTQIVTAAAGSNVITGGAGDDVLIGNGANDTLDAGSGNDMLFGGQGNSTFVIGKGDGNDQIFDFHSGDVVQLSGYGFAGSAAVTAAMTQAGSNVVLALGSGGALTFHNETIAALTPDAFAIAGTSPTAAPTPAPTAPPSPTPTPAPTPTSAGVVPVDPPDVSHATLTPDSHGAAHGTAASEMLIANGTGQTPIGGGGDDRLIVGTGRHVLTGGTGHDTFMFSPPRDRGNIVTDFTTGQDVLHLQPLLKAMHFNGSDPVADHVLRFTADAAGDTVLSVNAHGGSHAAVTLDHVLPQALHAGTDYV
ncbi:MAG: calcium-binding protein, partial [Acidimicrobiales bacterium]